MERQKQACEVQWAHSRYCIGHQRYRCRGAASPSPEGRNRVAAPRLLLVAARDRVSLRSTAGYKDFEKLLDEAKNW